jgi:hypothetical protein
MFSIFCCFSIYCNQKNENKNQQAKGDVHRMQPPNKRATTAGHQEGAEPKTGEDTGMLLGVEGHVISEMIRTKKADLENIKGKVSNGKGDRADNRIRGGMERIYLP